MIELLYCILALSVGLAFACCELASFWWLIPFVVILIILQLNPVWGLLAGVLLLGPLMFRRQQERKRQLQLTRELPDFVESLANCLRAGMTIEAAIKECQTDRYGPVKEVASNISHQLSLGVDLEQALKLECSKWPTITLMQQLGSAVSLSRQSGMDTSRLFDNLSKDARADLTAQERLLSLSAQARLQAWVIGLLPLGLFCLLRAMDPQRMQHFIADPRGQFVIGLIGLLELTGVIWIKCLIRI